MLSNTKESTEKRWAVCTVVPVILGCVVLAGGCLETATSHGLTEKQRGGKWVDVLKLIDVERDAKDGQWRFEDGVLVGFAKSALETPYQLPGEYDILWEFESESTAINLLLASPAEKRFEWMMKGWSHQLCAIREVDCKPANDNQTTTVYPLISRDRYVLELKVRNDRLVALINGREILNYETDWSDIEVCDPWHQAELEPRTLGLWLYKHWTKTYRLQVRPHYRRDEPLYAAGL
ncbi:MAG: hypothetical protein ACYTEL_11610 [Planctomycetota bacterium]